MVVSKEEKIKGNYDALRWTEEQEREPEGMPELDREALSKEGIPEECEEKDVLRRGKKKRKMPRRKKKQSRASLDMHQKLDESALALASLRKEREQLERDLQQLDFYGENVFKKALPSRDTIKKYGTLEMIYLQRLRAIRAKAAGRVAM